MHARQLLHDMWWRILSLVVVAATLVSATASLATYTKSFSHAIPELERQIAEVDVLLLILQETTMTFIDFGSLPKSVVAATKRCEDCYDVLKDILDSMAERGKKKSKFSKVRKNLMVVANEEPRRAAYHAFRDSVLLLRDLASDAKMQKKLSEMRYAKITPNHHLRLTQGNLALAWLSFWSLQHIPLRAKMDTGCDHNLVSMDILRREGIKEDQIEIGEEIELTGLEGTKYTLKKKITFTWYLKRNMKSRVGDFYIVEDDTFDVILGAHFWGGSGGKSALFLQRPWKSKSERRKEEVEHATNVANARAAEEAHNRKDLEARLKKRLPRVPTSSNPPPTGSSSGASNTNTSTVPAGGSLRMGASSQTGAPSQTGTSSQTAVSSQVGAPSLPGNTQSNSVP
ncbi:uncharacterized protein K441DRAFT_679371 [Cenococcum geophilum 1.58]|uniref:uncharacterized protein n=1 Tax=Cenococcum geophilum 1.58 TaxID=794803 RepID=UPI00358F5ED8|nr:hypothetical protein K441DRAFT_679371 [Cenococcum geophilum 1.58]